MSAIDTIAWAAGHDRKRTPEDDTRDALAKLRDGDFDDFVDPLARSSSRQSSETKETAEPGPPPAPGRPPDPMQHPAPQRLGPPRGDSIPAVIRDVLNSPVKDDLIAVANMLKPGRQVDTLIFHTPVGDIRCPAGWMSMSPAKFVDEQSSMLFVRVRSSEVSFVPKPGAMIEVSFTGVRGIVRVVILSEPVNLYPGVDLLCLLPYAALMEKTGAVQEGVPSVVSGRPSDTVVDGEPVVTGETPATAKLDFDQTRE